MGDDTPPARASDRRYIYPPSDRRFDEVSAFANAENYISWATQPQFGYKFNCSPFEIRLHAAIINNGTVDKDNAQYLPPFLTKNGRPIIEIGDGDRLQNLALDFDVIAHELGHHIIARRLTNRTGESRIIHEALADYLVYAKTGNACLAESICSPDAPCSVPNRCLRTAENNRRLDDPLLNTYQKAEALSGLLWDLGSDPNIGQETVAKVVFKAIDYFLPSSSFKGLFQALMSADLELNNGNNACKILDKAFARGLESSIQRLDCSAFRSTK